MRCALVAQRTCARVTREHWERKTSVLLHFVRILRRLYSVYMNICFHWLYCLKHKSVDIFPSCSVKKSRTFKNQKPISSTFKALKLTPEIQGFSRVFKMHMNPAISTDYQPIVNRLLSDYRPSVHRLSSDYQPSAHDPFNCYQPSVFWSRRKFTKNM